MTLKIPWRGGAQQQSAAGPQFCNTPTNHASIPLHLVHFLPLFQSVVLCESDEWSSTSHRSSVNKLGQTSTRRVIGDTIRRTWVYDRLTIRLHLLVENRQILSRCSGQWRIRCPVICRPVKCPSPVTCPPRSIPLVICARHWRDYSCQFRKKIALLV